MPRPTFNSLKRTGLAALVMAASLLTARSSLGQQNALANEARDAANYLNQIRANPRAFTHLHASLGDADVEARPALVWNEALQRAAERKAQFMAQTGQVAHVMTINGQQIGMNQWMREAGYPLADYNKNDATNFENVYGPEFGQDLKGIGRRVIDRFLTEGKDGDHVITILGRAPFWKPCKHIGIGMATNAQGGTVVSVLFAVYDSYNPDAQPPGQPAAPNPPQPNPPAPNNPPAAAPQGGQTKLTLQNNSREVVAITLELPGLKAAQDLPGLSGFNLPPGAAVQRVVPKGTTVKGRTESTAFGMTLLKDEETITYPVPAAPAGVVGSYQRDPVENTYHEGTIQADAQRPGQLVWTNKAGLVWRLAPDQAGNVLNKEAGSDYQNVPDGNAFLIVRGPNGEVTGFKFLRETYRKVR